MTAFEIDHDQETQSACSSSTRIYAYHTGCKPGEKFCDRTNATARSMVFAPRDERAKFYPDRQWNNGFIGNSYAGYAFAIPAVLVTSLTQQ
ncbi:hypothetical protein ACOJBM_05710 [Rhizobium beringeri]|uniref:Uncharacterized protein n=2 Tax=Rhizobium TaxID=379 RepID=A0A1L3ZP50_RHILE|nr:hypothetical protein [Rhizobium leguminosarum]API57443.1 hypothetical protein BMW22_39410 [Rhizobium leguminosarum]